MKKAILLFFTLFMVTTFLISQPYKRSEFVGTWYSDGSVLEFSDAGWLRIKFSNNTYALGEWDYVPWEATRLTLTFNNEVIQYHVQNKAVNHFSLADLVTLESFTLLNHPPRQQVSNSNSYSTIDGEALLFWGGLLFAVLASDTGSSETTFEGQYSNDANTNRYLRNAHEQDTRERY